MFEELARRAAASRGVPARSARAPSVPARGPRARRTVSVGGVIDYARCPKRFYWTAVRPLPRFSGPAARIGTEVHRWIERRAMRSGGAARGGRRARPHERGTGRRTGQGRTAERGVPGQPFRRKVTPLHAERPFLLRLEGFAVGGRIDAVYGESGGPVGGRGLEDGSPPGRRRSARGAPARPLRPGVRRDLGQAARGRHAHVPLPGERRRGLPSDGGPRRSQGARRRGVAVDRRGRVRSHPGAAVHLLRLPPFCPEGKAWIARERDRCDVRGARREPFDLLFERR